MTHPAGEGAFPYRLVPDRRGASSCPGAFDQSAARRYFPQDREAGFILLCPACPRSALRLLTHQAAVMRAQIGVKGGWIWCASA
jgi:hypothetical protein